jgi:hypothetical protein
MNMNGNDADLDANLFASISEDKLVEMGIGLFLYFLHDDYVRKFRKMLTLEQYQNSELSTLYSKQYMDDPLRYQAGLLAVICGMGKLETFDSDIMALQFYAPIYMLLTECDRHPEREAEALHMLERHIRQFNQVYSKGDK